MLNSLGPGAFGSISAFPCEGKHFPVLTCGKPRSMGRSGHRFCGGTAWQRAGCGDPSGSGSLRNQRAGSVRMRREVARNRRAGATRGGGVGLRRSTAPPNHPGGGWGVRRASVRVNFKRLITMASRDDKQRSKRTVSTAAAPNTPKVGACKAVVSMRLSSNTILMHTNQHALPHPRHTCA